MRMVTLTLLATLCLATTTRAAGLSPIEIAGSDGAALQGAVWSPCAAPSETVRLRRIEVPGVKNCPVAGERLPLIVMSHGGRGWFGGHHDTASALADAGFVVAAITHPDKGRAWQTNRPAAIIRLIDHMLGSWPVGSRSDRLFWVFQRRLYRLGPDRRRAGLRFSRATLSGNPRGSDLHASRRIGVSVCFGQSSSAPRLSP